ncbi:hypothetical protein NEIRO03_1929 [Nematocida sp. AWRm78]|nr:hypothetical protein NEIRO02_1957 [Nematocida sp. AWRm79]KAI5185047.1 hypothetical protein NEIRO03_1929 [Nematocida sp. AWRm78]
MQESSNCNTYVLTTHEISQITAPEAKKQEQAPWNTVSRSIGWFFFRHMPYILLLTMGFFLVALNMYNLLQNPNRNYIHNDEHIRLFKKSIMVALGICSQYYATTLLMTLKTRITQLNTYKKMIFVFIARIFLFLVFSAPLCYLLFLLTKAHKTEQIEAYIFTAHIVVFYTIIAKIISKSEYVYKKLTTPTSIATSHKKYIERPGSNRGFLFYVTICGLLLLISAIVLLLPCIDIALHRITPKPVVLIPKKSIYQKWIDYAVSFVK